MPQIFHESPVFKDGDCISMFCQDSLTELTVSFMVSRRCIENCSSCVASKVLENGGIDLQQTQCKDNGCKDRTFLSSKKYSCCFSQNAANNLL